MIDRLLTGVIVSCILALVVVTGVVWVRVVT